MSGERPPYEEWLRLHNIRETPDYDVRGAYNAGIEPDERGHLPDEFKLPNHITYSSESRSSQQEGAPLPGRWEGSDDDGWIFYASPTNITNAGSREALEDYFRRNEPGVRLVLPGDNAVGGVVIDDGNPAKRRKLI